MLTCDWVQPNASSQDHVACAGVQHRRAQLYGLGQAGKGADRHPSQGVDQARLGVDGDSQDGHQKPGVWVQHGAPQLQPLAWAKAPQPGGRQGLVGVTGSEGDGVEDEGEESTLPFPTVSWH